MGTGAWGRATLLLSTAGLGTLAGGSAECAAQTRADSTREGLSLGAAIAEARRSPFHSGARGGGPGHGQEAGVVGTAAAYRHLSLPGEAEPGRRVSFGLTLTIAELSHLVGAYMFLSCGYGRAPAAFCFLGPLLPLPVVALPATTSGVDAGSALEASVVGWLGGAAAFMVTGYITEQISNVNFFASALVSGLVHAGITTAMVRW